MSGRKFEEIVISYTPPELCTYPEYRGKPYYSIKFEENGEHFIGFGTYKIEVLSEYLREYFIQGQKLGCEICTNRNIKSKEACTSPFGKCEFFNATPDRSLEVAQKSIELGRSLGRMEERVESKRTQGKWIKIFENPFTNGYICPFCGHKIQVTEQFLPQVTECEVCGAELKGGSET
jgi:ribosomal protein L37AE/L43A